MSERGRNFNLPSVNVTTVTINAATATTILPANPNRLYAIVSMDFYNLVDEECFIREFAANVKPAVKQGILLSRITLGNQNIHRLEYRTYQDAPYTGEISAISNVGSFDLHITEGSF